MAAGTVVSVEQYLSTSCRPDCRYVEGTLAEPNAGERTHRAVQGALVFWFRSRQMTPGVWAYPGQRVLIKTTRFRVPNVCVIAGETPQEEIFTRPPFFCIEILPKDDRMSETHQRIDDYLEFDVGYVWEVDPILRRAWVHTAAGSVEVNDGVLRTQNPDIAVPLTEIFAAL
jgi:Uma2 family endonuclease